MQPGELVISVTLPPPARGAKSTYLKLRDRASYEFALASAAVVATVKGGTIERARIAMGGIGAIPWRNRDAEAALDRQTGDARKLRGRRADHRSRDAKPQSQNGFKVELARRCLIDALTTVATA